MMGKGMAGMGHTPGCSLSQPVHLPLGGAAGVLMAVKQTASLLMLWVSHTPVGQVYLFTLLRLARGTIGRVPKPAQGQQLRICFFLPVYFPCTLQPHENLDTPFECPGQAS